MPNYTTWNPADKSANIALSGGNLIATSGVDSYNSVRSVLGVTNGKYYWEIHTKQLTGYWDYFQLGIADSGVALDGEPGDDIDGYIYRGNNGKKENNGVEVAFGDTYGRPENTICIALDMDAGKLWWAKEGVWQDSGDPANGTNEAYSGISGVFYAIASIFGNTDYVTANFGASAFSYSVPSGFGSGLFSPYIDADITNPSMIAEGLFSGQCEVSVPMIQPEGFTGITAEPFIPMTEVIGYTGITAEPSISMSTVIVTGHDNIEHIAAAVTIPSMSAKLTQAKQIWGNVSIPSMIAEATERETTLANVSIPMMTVELASGVHADLEVTASMATAEGLFSGQAEITIPMMTAELEGKVGRIISSAVKVPMMTVEATGKTEHLVNGAVSIPMMRVATKLMTGKIIAGAAEIPMMTAALTSYEDITGDIDVSIPAMIAYLEGTTERAVCTVLRYDDKPDILGNIAAEIPMIEASLTEL